MTDEERLSVLAELVAAETYPPREDGEQTAQEIAEATGMTLSAVRYRLERLVREGRATTRLVRGQYDGRPARVWRII